MDGSSDGVHSFNPHTAELNQLRLQQNFITNDQRFLLLFITGIYFGPDISSEIPRKCAFQRRAECLASYSSSELEGASMKAAEFVSVYYYALRSADSNVILRDQLIYKFLRGELPPPEDPMEDHSQFTSFFPRNLHLQTRPGGYKTIENVIFINNPDMSCIRPEDMNRFKRLTNMVDLSLDRDAARTYISALRANGLLEEGLGTPESHMRLSMRRSLRNSSQHKHGNGNLKTSTSWPSRSYLPEDNHLLAFSRTTNIPTSERLGPAMLYLPSHPGFQEWNNIVSSARSGIALTGTVAAAQAGPSIGLVDVGVSEDAYLFQISLPGVKKDGREFSCEVECDGKVRIKGVVTTGETSLLRHSRIFEMQTQNLCGPGTFEIVFQLPGPVEPREFSGNFGRDGILEGIVMKVRR